MNADEATLIRQLQEGDESAYRTLLQTHLQPLSRYVMRMMSNAPDADDIIQETCLRLWTHCRRFDPGKAKLSTWLHNIAHNLCMDFFRKNNRLIEENDFETETENNGSLEASLTQSIQMHNVSNAMMTLPERQRSAIIMCHYQGMSNKEAAAVLNVSVDALESLMGRGRRKLRLILEK